MSTTTISKDVYTLRDLIFDALCDFDEDQPQFEDYTIHTSENTIKMEGESRTFCITIEEIQHNAAGGEGKRGRGA